MENYLNEINLKYDELKNLINNLQKDIDANQASKIEKGKEEFTAKLNKLLDEQKSKFASLEKNLTQRIENDEKIKKLNLKILELKLMPKYPVYQSKLKLLYITLVKHSKQNFQQTKNPDRQNIIICKK